MPAFTLDPANAAIVVVDMQNDFVRKGAPQEVSEARETLPAIQRLIKDFRSLPGPVVFTKFISGPNETLMWTWSPECAPPTCSCWPGVMRSYGDLDSEREGPDIVDEIYPDAGDLIIEKYGYNAFHHTRLADALRANGVTDLVVTGTVTQICIEDTVHGAFHEGYRTVVVSDAVSSYDEELQRATLRNIELKYGRVLPAEEVLAELAGSA